MLRGRLCAVTLILTAAIHFAVVPEHLREWPAAGVFFVALGLVEAALAVGALRPMDRRVLLVGALVSVGTVLLWTVSRTVGLPTGPEAFAAEPVRALDVVSTGLELATALLFFGLMQRAPASRAPFAFTNKGR